MKAFYASALDRYTSACSESIEKQDSLENFQSTCKKNGTDAGPGLPASLKLQFVERSSFPTIASSPEFFKKEQDELKKLQMETSQRVYDILLAAKEKHIAHLIHTVSRTDLFIEEQLTLFRKLVEDNNLAYSGLSPASSSSAAAAAAAAASSASQNTMCIPVELAVAHFKAHLTTVLATKSMEHFEHVVRHTEEKKQRRAAELAAQEKVVSGSNTRESMTDISKREASSALRPLQREVAQLKEQLRRAQAETAAAAATARAASKRSLEYTHESGKPAESPSNKQKVNDAAAGSSSSARPSSSSTSSSNGQGGDRRTSRGPVHDERREKSHHSGSSSRAPDRHSSEARPRDSERSSKDSTPSKKQ